MKTFEQIHGMINASSVETLDYPKELTEPEILYFEAIYDSYQKYIKAKEDFERKKEYYRGLLGHDIDGAPLF